MVAATVDTVGTEQFPRADLPSEANIRLVAGLGFVPPGETLELQIGWAATTACELGLVDSYEIAVMGLDAPLGANAKDARHRVQHALFEYYIGHSLARTDRKGGDSRINLAAKLLLDQADERKLERVQTWERENEARLELLRLHGEAIKEDLVHTRLAVQRARGLAQDEKERDRQQREAQRRQARVEIAADKEKRAAERALQRTVDTAHADALRIDKARNVAAARQAVIAARAEERQRQKDARARELLEAHEKIVAERKRLQEKAALKKTVEAAHSLAIRMDKARQKALECEAVERAAAKQRHLSDDAVAAIAQSRLDSLRRRFSASLRVVMGQKQSSVALEPIVGQGIETSEGSSSEEADIMPTAEALSLSDATVVNEMVPGKDETTQSEDETELDEKAYTDMDFVERAAVRERLIGRIVEAFELETVELKQLAIALSPLANARATPEYSAVIHKIGDAVIGLDPKLISEHYGFSDREAQLCYRFLGSGFSVADQQIRHFPPTCLAELIRTAPSRQRKTETEATLIVALDKLVGQFKERKLRGAEPEPDPEIAAEEIIQPDAADTDLADEAEPPVTIDETVRDYDGTSPEEKARYHEELVLRIVQVFELTEEQIAHVSRALSTEDGGRLTPDHAATLHQIGTAILSLDNRLISERHGFSESEIRLCYRFLGTGYDVATGRVHHFPPASLAELIRKGRQNLANVEADLASALATLADSYIERKLAADMDPPDDFGDDDVTVSDPEKGIAVVNDTDSDVTLDEDDATSSPSKLLREFADLERELGAHETPAPYRRKEAPRLVLTANPADAMVAFFDTEQGYEKPLPGSVIEQCQALYQRYRLIDLSLEERSILQYFLGLPRDIHFNRAPLPWSVDTVAMSPVSRKLDLGHDQIVEIAVTAISRLYKKWLSEQTK